MVVVSRHHKLTITYELDGPNQVQPMKEEKSGDKTKIKQNWIKQNKLFGKIC